MIVIANPGRPGLRARLAGGTVARLRAVSEIPVLAVGAGRRSRWRLRRPQRVIGRRPALEHA
jgi:hypothetical protein